MKKGITERKYAMSNAETNREYLQEACAGALRSCAEFGVREGAISFFCRDFLEDVATYADIAIRREKR